MPRLSITLTDEQAAALERIAKRTGATKQSMIGLAISDWIRTAEYVAWQQQQAEDEEAAAEYRSDYMDAMYTLLRDVTYTPSQAATGTCKELWLTVIRRTRRTQTEVAWLRGYILKDGSRESVIATAQRLSSKGEVHELSKPWEYTLIDGEDEWDEVEPEKLRLKNMRM